MNDLITYRNRCLTKARGFAKMGLTALAQAWYNQANSYCPVTESSLNRLQKLLKAGKARAKRRAAYQQMKNDQARAKRRASG